MKINYRYIELAKKHFEEFQYIEVPWVVSAKAINITRPIWTEAVNQHCLVASGEQSFLDLILQGKLLEGKYCCATPCYRPNDISDELHFPQFFKLELIEYFGKIPNDVHVLRYHHNLHFMISNVMDFVKQFGCTIKLVDTKDDPRACQTLESFDIEIDGVEYGSYGLRYHEDIGVWVYGTGVALPRFQQILG